MNDGRNRGDLLFRIVRWCSRWQLHSVLRRSRHDGAPRLLFAVTMGAFALGTITLAALVTDLPLLFPPLAPSAFILFTTPLAPTAAPRSVVLGHTVAVLCGLVALMAVGTLFPDARLHEPTSMNGPRLLAITLTMALVTVGLVSLRCPHPPAAASGLLAAMGLLGSPTHALALPLAAALLSLEAVVLLRIFGGMPYPLWRPAEDLIPVYGTLAGCNQGTATAWTRIHDDLLKDDLPDDHRDAIL